MRVFPSSRLQRPSARGPECAKFPGEIRTIHTRNDQIQQECESNAEFALVAGEYAGWYTIIVLVNIWFGGCDALGGAVWG